MQAVLIIRLYSLVLDISIEHYNYKIRYRHKAILIYYKTLRVFHGCRDRQPQRVI